MMTRLHDFKLENAWSCSDVFMGWRLGIDATLQFNIHSPSGWDPVIMKVRSTSLKAFWSCYKYLFMSDDKTLTLRLFILASGNTFEINEVLRKDFPQDVCCSKNGFCYSSALKCFKYFWNDRGMLTLAPIIMVITFVIASHVHIDADWSQLDADGTGLTTSC